MAQSVSLIKSKPSAFQLNFFSVHFSTRRLILKGFKSGFHNCNQSGTYCISLDLGQRCLWTALLVFIRPERGIATGIGCH